MPIGPEEQNILHYRKPVKECLGVLVFSLVLLFFWVVLVFSIRAIVMRHEDVQIVQETVRRVSEGLRQGRTAAVDETIANCVSFRTSVVDEISRIYADHLPVMPALRAYLMANVVYSDGPDTPVADELALRLGGRPAPNTDFSKLDKESRAASILYARLALLESQRFDLLPLLPQTDSDAVRSLPRNSIFFARFPLLAIEETAPYPAEEKNYREGIAALLKGELDGAEYAFKHALQEKEAGDAAFWLGAIAEAKGDAAYAKDYYALALSVSNHVDAAKALLRLSDADAVVVQ